MWQPSLTVAAVGADSYDVSKLEMRHVHESPFNIHFLLFVAVQYFKLKLLNRENFVGFNLEPQLT